MAKEKPFDYNKLTAELDKILEELQGGQLGIDDAIKNYQRGMQIVDNLNNYLTDAQNKVVKIKKNFEIEK